MSIHKSLVSTDTLKRQRSVLTRAERVEKLMADELWQEGTSVFGLPKVKVEKVVKKKKAKAEEKPEAEGVEGAEGEEATEAVPEE